MAERIRPHTCRTILIFAACLSMSACTARPFQKQQAERFYYQGQSMLSLGKQDEAYIKFDQSFKLSEKAGYRTGMAHNLNEKAIILTAKGHYDQAREALAQAVDIYKSLAMNPEVSKALNNYALTYLKENRFQESIRHYEVLLDWDRKTGNRLGEAIGLNQMGWIYAGFLKKPKKAYAMYAAARDIFVELEKPAYLKVVEQNIDTLLKQVSR